VKLIEKSWDSYKQLVVPGNASPVQIDETRKAFYAGAAGVLEAVLTCLGPGEEPTDADLKMMDSIKAEIDAFIAGIVKKGFVN
jgi:hypothetical protein